MPDSDFIPRLPQGELPEQFVPVLLQTPGGQTPPGPKLGRLTTRSPSLQSAGHFDWRARFKLAIRRGSLLDQVVRNTHHLHRGIGLHRNSQQLADPAALFLPTSAIVEGRRFFSVNMQPQATRFTCGTVLFQYDHVRN